MTKQGTFDEESLIAAAQRGNLDAFNELVLAYQDRAYNLAYRIMGDPASASDATQEAFISVYESLDRFRGGSFKSYLLRTVTNACYDELRRRKRRPWTSFEEFGEVEPESNPALIDEDEEGPEDFVERMGMSQAIQAGINILPPEQRITLILADVQEMSYKEIARITDVALGTVKSRLSRARSKLCEYLQEETELLPPRFRLKGEE